MTSYYYALWVPQIREGIPSVRKQSLKQVDLKDQPDDSAFLVKGEINRDTLHISLSYILGDAPCKTLLFQKIDVSDTGFLVYKLDLNDNDNDFFCEELRHTMPKAIYHYVKDFFHEHQFHNSDDDSLLDSYFSTSEINLNDKETIKKIIKVYLQSYINKYAGCVFLCRDSLYTVAYNQKHSIKLGDSLIELHNIMHNNIAVLDGESLYCDFIINSYPGLADSDQLQRIYGLRNELARYDERLQRIDASISSKESKKLGKWGLCVSVIGALLGAGLSYWLSYNSSKELQYGVNTIRYDVKQNRFQDSLTHHDYIELKYQQDSIMKLLSKQKQSNTTHK